MSFRIPNSSNRGEPETATETELTRTLLELASKWKQDSSKSGLMASQEENFVSKRPLEERWPPLGAPSSELSQETSRPESKVEELEEEHEKLNSSLLALTSHFAQVQFRLKQVVAAPKDEQADLLQNLEKFAFEGIPDVDGAKPAKNQERMAPDGYQSTMDEHRKKQEKLISQLKDQLQEMEKAVIKGASSGEDSPQKLIEKQKMLLAKLSMEDKEANTTYHQQVEFDDRISKEQVIKQITKQIIDLEKYIKLLQGETGLGPKQACKCSNCSCDHGGKRRSSHHLSTKEARKKAGLQSALKKSPLLTKRKSSRGSSRKQESDDNEESHWDDNLGVHYTVENFGIINEDNKYDSGSEGVTCCILPRHSAAPVTGGGASARMGDETPSESNQRIKEASLEIIKRALAILQIFAMSQFGCTGQHLQEQLIKKAMQTPVPPYEMLVRNLRKSVENVQTRQAEVLQEIGIHSPDVNPSGGLTRSSRSGSISSLVSTISSVGDGSGEFTAVEAELIRAVRREFSTCLRDLLEHGLEKNAHHHLISTRSFVSCIIPPTAPPLRHNMHAWDVFMAYYNIKNGRDYNLAVQRKLSESFGIDVSGSSLMTAKQTLLRTIHYVKSTHERCKRSKESMSMEYMVWKLRKNSMDPIIGSPKFRALVSAGLNQKKLALWCQQIVKCSSLVEENYQNWSCVVRTGFQEVVDVVECLTPLDFCLPEDLAIRHLTRANDAFGDSY